MQPRINTACHCMGEVPMDLLDVLQRHYSEHVYPPESRDDLEEYVAAVGNAAGALLYSVMYCPPLMEIDGMVLQAIQTTMEPEEYPEAVRRALEDLGGDHRQVESSFNLVYVKRMFNPDRRDTTDDEEMLLAEVLAEAWRAWLHWKYPGRSFVVEVLNKEETGDVHAVTFYEERQG